jgi:hypothetical protein
VFSFPILLIPLVKSTPSPALRLPSSRFRLEPNSRRPLRNIETVNNDKPSNDHDKSGDVHEKMQKRLSGIVFIR